MLLWAHSTCSGRDAKITLGTGDIASAVALLDGAVRKYEELLGLRNADVLSATKRWNDLFDTLSEDQKAKASLAFESHPLPMAWEPEPAGPALTQACNGVHGLQSEVVGTVYSRLQSE